MEHNKYILPGLLFTALLILMLIGMIANQQTRVYRSRADYAPTPTNPFSETPTPYPPSGKFALLEDAVRVQNQLNAANNQLASLNSNFPPQPYPNDPNYTQKLKVRQQAIQKQQELTLLIVTLVKMLHDIQMAILQNIGG